MQEALEVHHSGSDPASSLALGGIEMLPAFGEAVCKRAKITRNPAEARKIEEVICQFQEDKSWQAMIKLAVPVDNHFKEVVHPVAEESMLLAHLHKKAKMKPQEFKDTLEACPILIQKCSDQGREELKEVWKEMRKIGDDKKLTPHDAMRALHAVMLSATSVRTPCSPPSSKSPRRRTQPRLGNSRAAAVGMDATRQEPVRTILVQQCIKQPPEQLKAFAEDRELLVMVNDWLVECRDDGTTGGAAALISNTVRAPKLEIVVGRARDATDGQLGVRSLFVAAVLESNPESRALRRGRVTAVTGSCGCCCGYRWIRSRRFARRGCLTRCDASAPTTPSTRSARWLSKWPRSGRPSRRPPRLPRRP